MSPDRVRVLVVDDDQSAVDMIGQALATRGIDVVGFRDPVKANARIQTERFDGIFIDLTMPVLTGLELEKRVRHSLKNGKTPIVVISGRPDSEAAMKEAFAAGAHFFLSKPLNPNTLYHLINAIKGTLLREHLRNHWVPLAVEISGRWGSRSLTGQTSQVCENGVVFRSFLKPEGRSLAPGAQLHVTFCLPRSQNALEAMTTIMSTEDQGDISCQFRKLDEEAREEVQAFVASLYAEAPEDPEVKGVFAAGRS